MHKTYREGGKGVPVITQVIVTTTSRLRMFQKRKKKKYFYKTEVHTQGKANGEELESCTPGMRCALSAEMEESLETI